ncbi:MAG: aminotransferase class I/II-fold pyridoxal phosphate-dependent enzyme, partial [Pseudomonadota bacterium]
MSFDFEIDRRGTHCMKWDLMEQIYGVPADEGLSMWVADMDFRPPQVVQDAVQEMVDHGVYGYFGDESKYRAAIQWWMAERHKWDIDDASIFTTHGLVNGTGMCVDAFTEPRDGVILFTPVYHAFARVIRAANREVVEMEMVNVEGRYELDFDAYDAAMTGREKMVILCSPHNPGGRVWTRSELEGVAEFARKQDLILVSDEIHHDLTFGAKHTPLAHIEGIEDRLVMMTATT